MLKKKFLPQKSPEVNTSTKIARKQLQISDFSPITLSPGNVVAAVAISSFANGRSFMKHVTRHPRAFRTEASAHEAGKLLAPDGKSYEVVFEGIRPISVPGPSGMESNQPSTEYYVYY